MSDRPSRTRLQLGAELQTCRTLAGITQRALATSLDVSQSLVARVERGERLLSRPDIETWLSLVDAPADARDRIVALVEEAHTETRTWRDLLGGTPHLQDQVRQRESGIVLSLDHQFVLIPGLLQTPDYARATLPLFDPEGLVDPTGHVATRIARQSVLRKPDCRFAFLIAERLLRWEPEPGVLETQLTQLAATARLAAVDIAILPEQHAGPLAELPFTIESPADGSSTRVLVELVHGAQIVTDPTDVGFYQRRWDALWSVAVTGDDAIAMIRAAIR